jgi:hypothetical protein
MSDIHFHRRKELEEGYTKGKKQTKVTILMKDN